MSTEATTTKQDVTFRFPDGHTWAYASHERVWMGEVPIGAEWADCEECDQIMERIGEPSSDEIPFAVVSGGAVTDGPR